MFPMISDVGEVKAAIALLHEVQDQIRAEGLHMAEHLETGVMIEVPSAALCADLIAPHVDFFSIGSNDLIQYTLAIDRGNDKVANLYQPAHPAILRLIQMIVDSAHKNHIWVGVCGEMAADVSMAPALIGLGIDELSAGAGLVPRVKRAVQSLNFQECRQLMETLLAGPDAAENQAKLNELARRLYPEIL
jgi:phosphotransferase system enzyme I (PtsI)